jgi:hypothetical protein
MLAREFAHLARWSDAAEVAKNPDTIIATADELIRGLNSFVRSRVWTVQLNGELTCTLFKAVQQRRGRGPGLGSTRGKPVSVEFGAGVPIEAFFLRVIEIIQAEGTRILSCSERGCRKLFVRRKRGKFCWEHSGSAEYSRRWRAGREPSEVKKSRRDRYLRQKAEGQNRKVETLVKAHERKNKREGTNR